MPRDGRVRDRRQREMMEIFKREREVLNEGNWYFPVPMVTVLM